MTHAALAPLIGAEFDKFLCAPIREDRNGTPLSVLSALARLDVDPWQEAASLARMPRDTAATRLTALIVALPGELTKDDRHRSRCAATQDQRLRCPFARQRVCNQRTAAGADPLCFGRTGHHGFDRACAFRQSFLGARQRRQVVGRSNERSYDGFAARAESLNA
jgi:hypothetical protein